MTVTSNSYPNQTGSQTVYQFDFELISNTNLYASIDDVVQPQTEYTVGTPSANQVTFNAAPTGDLVLFRVTNDDPIRAVFAAGSAIRAKDLNNNFEQLLFLAQEFRDNLGSFDSDINNKVETITGTEPIVATRTGGTVNISATNATTSADGTMSSADKTKLDNLPEDAASGTVTGVTGTAPVEVTSSTTTPNVSMLSATSSRDGYMSKEYAEKLDSVEFVEVHNATFTEAIDGTRTTFTLNKDANSAFDLTVSVNGVIQQANVHYTWDSSSKEITFTAAPPVNSDYWITISGFQRADGTVGGYQTANSLPLEIVPSEFSVDLDFDNPTQADLNQLVASRLSCYRNALTVDDIDGDCYLTLNHPPVNDGHLINKGFADVNYASVGHNHSEYALRSEIPTDLAELTSNVALIIDAKFDALRAAIAEATDFASLKVRLLAVLN